ncbi:MAG: TolC family protein [Proteobacteria bacterium]|nr:TolC family protein [Pseudomonadota bacterium]MBU1739737.1 TolC family protein [Pseudomonadota bacterium]
MICRFQRCVCSIFLIILQIFLLQSGSTFAAEAPIRALTPESTSAKDYTLHDQFFTPETSPRNSSAPPSPEAELDGFGQATAAPGKPGAPNLAGLMGVPEIQVLADVDGQFVKSMADYQILDKEGALELSRTGITESIRAGRGFNRESLAALARKEQAEAQTGQALALLLPSVSVRANYGEEKSEPSVIVDETTGELVASDTHDRTDASLVVRQPLYNLPVFLDWRRRQKRELVSGENYRASEGDAYVSTVSTYLTLVASRLQADIIRDFEAQLADLLDYIEKRADAGASSISDMSRVRARRQETLSSRLEQESAHLAAGIEFVRLTNLVPRKVTLPVVEDVGVALLPKSFPEAVAKAIEANPEITALNAELEAAKIQQSAAKGQFLPRFDLEYTDTFALHAGGEPNSQGQRDRRLMMVMNWDLFNSGKDYLSLAERKARYKELQYRLDDQQRRVVQELSANYAALATTGERIVSGYEELESISTATEAMSKRMLSGNQSLLDLLTVYDSYYQVRSRLVNLHVFEMNTVAQLVRLTMGTPWTDAGKDN